jgi:fructosamine-3-kinase
VSETYRKQVPAAPNGYTRWEAAGLAWLAEAATADPDRPGAVTVAVRAVTEHALDLDRLTPRPGGPTVAQSGDFGRRLAATHAAGAPTFGAPPPDWPANTPGFLGPAAEPLPLTVDPVTHWGEFFGLQRIAAVLRLGVDRGLWPGQTGVFERVVTRLTAGEFDDAAPPARLHGDLWSGNILWTEDGGVLIDPAAHGGHAETDLAMLALFGAPHLETIVAAYAEAASGTSRALASGWRERVGLHQLHPVMLHAVLFGGGYEQQALRLAERYR